MIIDSNILQTLTVKTWEMIFDCMLNKTGSPDLAVKITILTVFILRNQLQVIENGFWGGKKVISQLTMPQLI